MPLFVVTLDGGEEQPERSGEITVEAKDAADAKTFAEQQNPGLKAVDAKKQ